jgi:N-acetylglucosaminyldiphosphoundecaprenol N-acetyl-beta-D-mannosaminyltransferase
MKVDLFGLKLDALTLRAAVQEISNLAGPPEGGRSPTEPALVVTPNVDHLVLLQQSAELRAAYAAARLVLADGMPIVWTSRLVGRPLPGRVTGADLLPALAAEAEHRGHRMFLLGGAAGVPQAAAASLMRRHPRLPAVGVLSPPFGFDADPAASHEAVARVRAFAPDLLFVGLGSPRQEVWAHRHIGELGARVVLCVGAAIDFAAGRVLRAPRSVRSLGLEWAWRLLREPRRLAGRYLVRDLRFGPMLLAEVWRAAAYARRRSSR